MKPDRLSSAQLGRATLARQMLLEREHVATPEAVERLCGMQAQEPKPPFIGLWSRLAGFRRDDLHESLHRRDVVRGTLMRATLHLTSARDYAALRAPLQPVMTQAMGALGQRAEGMEVAEVLPVARALLLEEPRSFNELRGLLVERFPGVNPRALGFAVRMHLPLVMVPSQDRWAFPSVAGFTLAETWLGEPLRDDAGPQGLALRYLAAFGPATAADAQTWSGLRGMRAVLEDLRPRLRVFRDERGRALFDLPEAPRPAEDVPAPPRFLPEFDNLVLSHADRTRVLADEHRAAVVTRNLRVRATFLSEGRVGGTWDVERTGTRATLHVRPFAALPGSAARALAAEGEALVRFVEEDAAAFEVTLDPPG